MTNEERQNFVEHLVGAKRELARAWSLVDGIDGATDEAERAFSRATEAIDDVCRSRPPAIGTLTLPHRNTCRSSGRPTGNFLASPSVHSRPPLVAGRKLAYRAFGPSVS
jgi:hypothetical protein